MMNFENSIQYKHYTCYPNRRRIFALGGFFMTVAKETKLCQDELVKKNVTNTENNNKEEIIV
jgi:hypothetical protein